MPEQPNKIPRETLTMAIDLSMKLSQITRSAHESSDEDMLGLLEERSTAIRKLVEETGGLVDQLRELLLSMEDAIRAGSVNPAEVLKDIFMGTGVTVRECAQFFGFVRSWLELTDYFEQSKRLKGLWLLMDLMSRPGSEYLGALEESIKAIYLGAHPTEEYNLSDISAMHGEIMGKFERLNELYSQLIKKGRDQMTKDEIIFCAAFTRLKNVHSEDTPVGVKEWFDSSQRYMVDFMVDDAESIMDSPLENYWDEDSKRITYMDEVADKLLEEWPEEGFQQ
jgi:hypothetical protein